MTTGRINQVCASPQSGAGWINHRTSSAAVNKVWFCHHTHSNRRGVYCTLSELAPWHLLSRRNGEATLPQGAFDCRVTHIPKRGVCSSHALQFWISRDTQQRPKSEGAKYLLRRMLSWIPMATMTMLVGTEPNCQSTTMLLPNPGQQRSSTSILKFSWTPMATSAMLVGTEASCLSPKYWEELTFKDLKFKFSKKFWKLNQFLNF